MAPTWSENGPGVVQKQTLQEKAHGQNSFRLEKIRALLSPKVELGQKMVATWSKHGPNMVLNIILHDHLNLTIFTKS